MHKILKSCLITWTLILINSQSFGQSYLYNENGQLIADTALRISPEQYAVWKRCEHNIVTYLSEGIEYSAIARDAGIRGTAIAAFICDSG